MQLTGLKTTCWRETPFRQKRHSFGRVFCYSDIMKCSWCGLMINSNLKKFNDGQYHNGCLDAKIRVEVGVERPPRKKIKARPQGSYYHAPDSPSKYYLDKLADFKKRMAKRGISV